MTDELPTDEVPLPLNLVWLPNAAGALTTMCRGTILTVERRSTSQWPWAVAVAGNTVSEGVSPTLEHAQTAAIGAAMEVAGGTTA